MIYVGKCFAYVLSLFLILFQVDCLSPPLCFCLLGIYHVPLHADISLPFHFV